MLGKKEILELIDFGFIKNALVDDVQSASMNLRFSDSVSHFRPGVEDIQANVLPLDVIPGRIYTLASTQVFELPPDIAAMICMRRSGIRLGLSLASGGSGLVSPGYLGSIAIDCMASTLARVGQDAPIAEICFWRVDSTTDPAYTGTYQGRQLGRSIPPTVS